ncbi:hypothetical protein [Alicyclobacillus contaminans]|uniref:hypothetical protein n=1 Tax=Alicyclobacillus contaminans TaxID=392016 RepID=UPI00040E38C4|nr:hypothetical protein [Alicyclobacillus contaminans]
MKGVNAVRTLRGYEALEIAEQHQVPLYDVDKGVEVDFETAHRALEQHRPVDIYVIYDWPTTEQEAEEAVLSAFETAMFEHNLTQASLFDLSVSLRGGLPTHLRAAELAAEQLVATGRLEVVEQTPDSVVYRLPQNTAIASAHLEEWRTVVCRECAHLNPQGPFHEACLRRLINHLAGSALSADELIEIRRFRRTSRRTGRTFRPISGMEWLSRTASATRQRLQEVWKPIFSSDEEEQQSGSSHVAPTPTPSAASRPIVHHEREEYQAPRARELALEGRKKITKSELIQYLQQVEIVDEGGEIMHLRQDNQRLQSQLADHMQRLEKVEQQRAYVEQQYQEMQRDMDVLLEALQIAKRRSEAAATSIVDVSYSSEDASRE